jgi:hypothetical protein
MTSKEFILWLKGFSEGVHEYNITPKQWDILKDKLAEVKDDTTSSPFPFGVPNTAPIQTLPFIQPYDPYNPYKITSGTNGVVLTSLSGSNGTVTYNPSTTTQWNPSGSNWSYTNNTYRTSADTWNEHQARMAYYKPYKSPYLTDTKEVVIKKEE